MFTRAERPSIILHTQYYPPEIGAPQARLSQLAQGLASRGFQVTVLTGMPSYPRGKVFAGYGGLWRVENQGGIKVIRTYLFPTQSARLIPRLLNYFSFMLSSLLVGGFTLQRAEYLITESPPLFLGLSGYCLSRLVRARWIFNVSDLWPESAVRLGAISTGLTYKISAAVEKFCYQKSWLVTGQSASILQNIQARFPDQTTYHLSNGVDPQLFSPSAYDPAASQLFTHTGEIVVFYGGLHGLAQGLEQILYAARKVQGHADGKIHFVFVGDGPEKRWLLKLAVELALDNITFLEPVEKQQMPSLLCAADICVVPLKTYLPGAVPSKLYEAMAVEKPVILIAEGEAADILCAAQAGVVIQPGNIDGLVQAILDLAADECLRRNYGRAGREAVIKAYDRAQIVSQFAEFLTLGTRP